MDERKLKELEAKAAIQQEHLDQKDIDTKTSVVSGAAGGAGAINTSHSATTREEQEDMEQKIMDGLIT